jgi:nucleotide-binding universal stress UspA family protein
MYRAVLVPLDGSPLAERALPHALRLARAGQARLILLTAVLAPGYHDAEAREEHATARREAEHYLDTVVARLKEGGSLPGVETCVRDGEAPAVIAAQAAEQQADLVVIATHGRSGIGRWLYGSVADDVLRHAATPVFLVPAAAPDTWPADGVPPVLIPLDGSTLAQEAINAASDLATTLGADVVLVQVVELPVGPVGPFGEPYAYIPYDPSAAVTDAKQYLEGIAAILRQRGHRVTVETPVGFAAQEIAAVARERGAGVIAMATRGRGGLARLVLGSVATGTLQRTNVPLLLVGPAVLGRATAEPAAKAVFAGSRPS